MPGPITRIMSPPLLNWFRARGELSSAAVEGLNNKCRVINRRSYGLHAYNGIEVALYQTLGQLPEPKLPTDSAEEARKLPVIVLDKIPLF